MRTNLFVNCFVCLSFWICSAEESENSRAGGLNSPTTAVILPSSTIGQHVFSKTIKMESDLENIRLEAFKKDVSLAVRTEALLTLGRLREYLGSDDLIEVINDDSEADEVRSVAVIALFSSTMNDRNHFQWDELPMVVIRKERYPIAENIAGYNEFLFSLLRQSDGLPLLRSVVVQILAILAEEETGSDLASRLADVYFDSKSSEMKSSILSSLYAHPSEHSVAFLSSIVKTEKDPYIQFKIVMAIPEKSQNDEFWLSIYHNGESASVKILAFDKLFSQYATPLKDDTGRPRNVFINPNPEYVIAYLMLVDSEIEEYRNPEALLNIAMRLQVLTDKSIPTAIRIVEKLQQLATEASSDQRKKPLLSAINHLTQMIDRQRKETAGGHN